mmetsp:Transcript_41525/g.54669  ORF Transcript_41525/g.54669 Transcript_41525/m.54669 type:complete len:106 (+) Transcript_41525:1675-1992(+)
MDNHDEREEELLNETLPGSCKSFYALKFRLQTDKDNANFAQRKETTMHKTSTKGRFPIPYKTNAGMWMKDREWKQRANVKMHKAELSREAIDVDMLERRKKQKLL